MIKIKMINKVTGKSEYVSILKNTCRGSFKVSKTWKTEASAKRWISVREKEMVGTLNEGKFEYEIVK